MCCRYYVPGEMSEFLLLKYLDQINDKPKKGEIFPTDLSPVLYGKDNIAMTGMKWGFSTTKGVVFNARGETYNEKYLFSPPAPFAFFGTTFNYLPSGRRTYLYFAGIYRILPNNDYEFTIITLPPVESIAPLHDRMPLAIDNAAAEEWLKGRDIQTVFKGVPELCYEIA